MLMEGEDGMKKLSEILSIFKGENKKKNTVDLERKSAQEWLPFYDISNSVTYMRDGSIVAGLEIEPINIDLFSNMERKVIITGMFEAFNGLQTSIQILSLGRPVDLDGYLKGLEEQMKSSSDIVRKKLLNGYIKKSASMAASGETIEKKFYILASSPSKDGADELKNNLMELSSGLQSAGLKTKLLNDTDLINLNFIFTHPVQAAFERGPKISEPYIPPVFDWSDLSA